MKRSKFGAAAFAAGALLSACGGGNGALNLPAPTGTPTSTPAPAGSVTAIGQLVDHETGLPLPGIQVGLAPWIAGATPVPQPATDANGAFVVSAPGPGRYLLVIGSNLANDPNNRPTIHEALTLTAGLSQALVAPTMPPVPSTTPNPVEAGGKFRLTTLTANEQSCFAIENAERTSLAYSPVISDEWLVENQRMIVQQEVNGGGVGGDGVLSNYNGIDGAGCNAMVNNDYTVTTNMGNPDLVWYSGDEVSSSNGAVDEGMMDPRGPLALPTPSSPWP